MHLTALFRGDLLGALLLDAHLPPRGNRNVGAEQVFRPGMRVFRHQHVIIIEEHVVEPAVYRQGGDQDLSRRGAVRTHLDLHGHGNAAAARGGRTRGILESAQRSLHQE